MNEVDLCVLFDHDLHPDEQTLEVGHEVRGNLLKVVDRTKSAVFFVGRVDLLKEARLVDSVMLAAIHL